MSTLTLRSTKGAPLTNTEVDNNFSNLNTDKLELGGTYSGGTANGVAYLDGSKVLTSGSALTFDGSILNITGTATMDGLTVDGEANIGSSGTQVRINSSSTTGIIELGGGTTDVIRSSAATDGLRFDSGGSYKRLIIANNGDISFYNSSGFSQAFFWDASAERLGLGSASPSSKLYIENTAGNDGIRIINSTSGEGYIIFGDTADSNTGSIAYNHTSDSMAFDVNNQERMVIDSSGNLGLGVTPSAWGGSYKAFQIGNRSLAQTGAGAGDWTMAFNAVYDSTDSRWEYMYTGDSAVRYSQTGAGTHTWYTAPSGTAGNAITFTQAMTLDASGRLLVGRTTQTGALRLQVEAQSGYSISTGFHTSSTQSTIEFKDSTTTADFKVRIGSAGDNLLMFAGGTERARITADGDLLVGTTSTPRDTGIIDANIKLAAQVFEYGLVSIGSIKDFYNGGSGRVFTITGGSNGGFATLEFTASNQQGYVRKVYSLYNGSGNWNVVERESVTSGTAQTVTVSGSGTSTATITVNGSTINYQGGLLDFKITTDFPSTAYVKLTS